MPSLLPMSPLISPHHWGSRLTQLKVCQPPRPFSGSTTWICEPILALLFSCPSCAFQTLTRDLQVWQHGHLVPQKRSTQLEFPEGNVPGYVCNHGFPRERDAALHGHMNPVILLQCEKVWKTSPVTRHHCDPALWRNNYRQTIWMSSIADLKNHSGPLHIQHTPSLNWSTLQCSEHQNVQTQEQFLSPSNPSHEHLTIIMAYTIYTLIHFFICTSIAHNIPVHTKLSIVIYLYIQLSICILLFRIYLFFFYLCLILSLSFCYTALTSVTKTNSTYV